MKLRIKPKHLVLCCPHVPSVSAPNLHWWNAKVDFARPDGTMDKSDWIACCNRCFEASGGNIRRILINGEIVVKKAVDINIEDPS